MIKIYFKFCIISFLIFIFNCQKETRINKAKEELLLCSLIIDTISTQSRDSSIGVGYCGIRAGEQIQKANDYYW
jgi:hypothetical protein